MKNILNKIRIYTYNREIDLVISKQPEEYDEETGEVLSEIIIAQLKIKNNSDYDMDGLINLQINS